MNINFYEIVPLFAAGPFGLNSSYFVIFACAFSSILSLLLFNKIRTSSIVEKAFTFCILTILLFLPIAVVAIDNLNTIETTLDNTAPNDAEKINNISNALRKSAHYIVFIATYFILFLISSFLFLYFKISKPILSLRDEMKTIIRTQELKKIAIHSNDEIGALATSFNTMLDALTDAQRKRNEKQTILNNDLKAAAQVQGRLLPSPSLSLPKVNLAWAYLPCYIVGGDLFNAIQLDENRIIFYILDVSGHDVTSAMVTVSIAQFLMRQQMAFAAHSFSPKEIMTALDTEFPFERFEKYFTIFYSIFDINTGKLCYSSAGHPPAILLHPERELELLECGGTVIGLNQFSSFHEEEITLEKGSKLILYTDGIIEFCNPEGTFFGEDRLYSLMEKNKLESAKGIEQEFRRELREFGVAVQSNWQDDVSFMCIEFI